MIISSPDRIPSCRKSIRSAGITVRRIGCLSILVFLLSALTNRADDTTNAATDSPGATNTSPSEPAPTSQPLPDSTNSATDSSSTVNATANPAPLGMLNMLPHRAIASTLYQFVNPEGQPDELANHLLVVYNTNDPDSKDLANYYASRRDIPDERVLGIACPLTEEITRQQYESTIHLPIMAYLYQKDWISRRSALVQTPNRTLQVLVANYNDIWAIVLMRGVPLKIAQDPAIKDSMEADIALQSNAAAVDSELALLPITGLPAGGFVPNPFFDREETGKVRVGPELATKIVLVTRLDGPKPSDVRRMIDDSLWAEQNRLAGLAVIDSRGFTDVSSGYTLGDSWLRSARTLLADDGWSVKFDQKPETIPATDPCNHVALYLGWYADNANGPWITPPNRFEPGAIAYHLHSFSAATVRSETQNWVGPLIAHGATATMGTVYEPYLGLTPHLDIFTKRLLMGQSFAEAAYASEQGLSWMVTVVGDPLYRPFARPIESVLLQAGANHTQHNDWLYLQFIQRSILTHRLTPDRATLEGHLAVPGASGVAYEGLADMLSRLTDPPSIIACDKAYQKALALDPEPIDRIRVGLKLAQHEINHGQDAEAQDVLKQLRDLYPLDAERFGVVSQLVPTGTQATPP